MRDKHFRHAFFDGIFRLFTNAQAKADVLGNGHIREKRIRLKDHAHVALVWGIVRYIHAINGDGSRCWNFKTCNHAQCGRLATTRRTQKRNELSFFHFEIEILYYSGAS